MSAEGWSGHRASFIAPAPSRRRTILLGALAASWGLAACATAPVDPGLQGDWTAVLEVGSQRLRLRLTVGTDGRASLFSLDQDNQAIDARVARTGDRVELTMPSIHGRYFGRLQAGERIEGTWNQGLDLPLVWLRGDAAYAMPARAVEALDQDALDVLRKQCGAPAMAAAAARRGSGEPLRLVSGVRSSFSHTAATTQDVWHLGSITKSITATLVARLVEAGKMRWTDTVGDLLGGAVPQLRAEYRDASFRHLLSHRAGLPSDIPLWQFMRFAGSTPDVIEARRRYAAIALGMAPLSALGASYAYANNGYVVAGAMLEAKLGESTELLTQRHVFAPLGLTSAGFGPPGRAGELTEPVGHQHDIESVVFGVVGLPPLKPQPPDSALSDNPVPLGPAGRAHMSLDDMLHFLAAHRDRTSFLSPRSWDELHTPPFGGQYAMGWMRRTDGSLWHNGSNNRWYAEVMVDAANGVCAFAVANEARGTARVAVGQALLRVARAL